MAQNNNSNSESMSKTTQNSSKAKISIFFQIFHDKIRFFLQKDLNYSQRGSELAKILHLKSSRFQERHISKKVEDLMKNIKEKDRSCKIY